MHEAQLARQVLDAVLARAREAQASRVLAVRGWLADPEGLGPDSLAFHFAAHARGTAAEGATLAFAIRRIPAACDTCQAVFASDDHVPVCPACGGLACRWLAAPGLAIEELDLA